MSITRELQSIWHRDIPITAAMRVEVAAYDGDELRVTAAHAPNVNVHGTAFGGSLYAVCTLTGWGLIWLKLRERESQADIFLAEAHTRYRRGVDGEIVCLAHWPSAENTELDEFLATGRARIALDCRVVADGRDAVRFRGDFALRAG